MNDVLTAFPRLWIVAAVDFVATYLYAFAVNELPYGRSGPHASWIYWATQPWVYGVIAPVALAAAWRGTRHVLAARMGSSRWWRLCVEGAVAGGASIAFVALFEGVAILPAIAAAAILGAGLGLFLTCINLGLVRGMPGILERRAEPTVDRA